MTVFGKQVVDNVQTEGHYCKISPSEAVCQVIMYMLVLCCEGLVVRLQTANYFSVRQTSGESFCQGNPFQNSPVCWKDCVFVGQVAVTLRDTRRSL